MQLKDLYSHYGPVAIVTGASSGIGYAFAEQLAACGFELVLVARREQRLKDLAAKLQSQTRTHLCPADLSEPQGIDAVISACQGLNVGLLVSNAGFGLKGAHHLNNPQTMQQMLGVNCNAPMQLTHRLIPQLVERDRAGIIITSSVEGLMGFPYSAPYAASKAFTNSLAEGLWGELSPQGVDVLALCPGSTDTEAHALQGIDQSKLEGMMSATEVAQLALAHIDQGPVYIAGEQNQEMFAGITSMPRRDALLMMAQTMQESFK
jgi:short-subunit dehydrogenase